MSSHDHGTENDRTDWWSDSKAFADLVEKAMKRAVKQAIEEHHRAGHPVSIWRDGRIVRLYPDGSVQPVPSNEPADGS